MAEASPAPHSPVTRWMGQGRSQRSHFGLELQANRFIHFLKLLLAVASPPPTTSGLAVGAGRPGSRRSPGKRELPGFEGSFLGPEGGQRAGRLGPRRLVLGHWVTCSGQIFSAFFMSLPRAARKQLSFMELRLGLNHKDSPFPHLPGPEPPDGTGPGTHSSRQPGLSPPRPCPRRWPGEAFRLTLRRRPSDPSLSLSSWRSS